MKHIRKIQLLVCGFILILVIVSIHIIFGNNSSLPAQTADNILRPLLGSKNTIMVESWYFELGDKLKQVKYVFVKPSTNVFNNSGISSPLSKTEVKNNDSMYLAPISPNNKFPSLPQEGIWQDVLEPSFPNQPVIAKTFIRPDPVRPYAIASLVEIDMKKLSLGVQAGTYYPGGTYHVYGPGIVPKNIQKSNSLIAVFNGGFMERDGHYGMMVNNKTYVPLRNNLATLVVSSTGPPKIIDYLGQPFDKNVIGVRQNGAFLIRNGSIVPYVEKGIDTWGRTTTNSMYTWRSGVGITKNGDLIYAVGNSLVPQTLAKALHDAGAQNAMQLDINPYWVRFILYYASGGGNYSYQPLLKDMQNGGYSYLHGYNKDFFYIYKKS